MASVHALHAAHARRGDRVTSWWRGTSLRAKVTGVTVAVLAVGLLAAGLGTRVAADAPQGASAIVIPMSGDWSGALTAAHGPVVVVSEGGRQPPR